MKGNKILVASNQVAYHTSYSRYGGVSFFLVKDPRDKSLYLFDGIRASELFDIGIDTKYLYHGSCFKELFSVIGSGRVQCIGVGAAGLQVNSASSISCSRGETEHRSMAMAPASQGSGWSRLSSTHARAASVSGRNSTTAP